MKIVFVGNCQAGALRALFYRYVQPHTGDESGLVASYEQLTDADRAEIETADRLVVQAQDFTAKAGDLDLPKGVPVHRFPVVSGAFLWPFGGRDRPGNKPEIGLPSGPYPIQLGNSYLNRLLRDGVDPAEAARRYIDLDFSTVTDLDRLYNIAITKQKRMDEAFGFDVATIIADHFRDEALFLTPYHPETRIIKHLAVTLFRDIGVPDVTIDRMVRLQNNSTLPPSESPIHPAIARHFGLSYIPDDKTYRFHNEGLFGFEEWVRRYLDGTWNRQLADGILRTHQHRPPGPVVQLLREALRLSPGSGPGWVALAQNLFRQGDRERAVAAARKGARVDPDNPRVLADLGTILLHTGDHRGAVQPFRRALEIDPTLRDVRRLMPQAMTHARQYPAALAMVRDQIDDPLEPPNSEQLSLLARLESRAGDATRALALAERAVEMQPDHPAALTTLAELLTRQGRHREAQFCLRQVLEHRPNNPGALYALARSCHATADFAAALDAIQKAIAIDAHQASYHALLSRILARQGRIEDAEQAGAAALALKPDDEALGRHLAALRDRMARKGVKPAA